MPPTKSSLHADAKLQTTVATLQDENARLLRQLDRAKAKTEDLVRAVYRAARDAADQVEYESVAAPAAKDRRKDDPETALLVMSDWQLAKRTPTYTTEVCERRVDEYVTKVMRLTDIQRADRPIRRAVVALAGDMVEGEQIFPGQCVDEETEALTPTGWRRLDDLLLVGGTPICTYDPDSDTAAWDVPSRWNVYDYDGEMVSHRTLSVDHFATPNHDMWVRCNAGWHRRKAAAVGINDYRVRVAFGKWDGVWTAPPVEPSDKCPGWEWACAPADLARLVGWIVSEASVRYGEVCVWQSRAANPDKWTEIRSLLDRVVPTMPGQAGRPVTFSISDDGFTINSVPLSAWVAEHLKTSSKDAHLPSWVKAWPTAELEALLGTLIAGDGSGSEAAPRYTTTSDQLADDVQEVCLKLGYGAVVNPRRAAGTATIGSWTGHCSGTLTVRISKRAAGQRCVGKPTWVRYRGRVWCPTVRTGLWLMRRNGKVCVTGNSHRIDGSLFRQTMLDGPRILGDALPPLLGYFDEVQVYDVVGNHGRIGRRGDYHPETNADAMLYHATWARLESEKRLTWTPNYQPGERAWSQVFAIGEHKYFLFHGDQMRGGGFAGIPMYGFIRAMMAWAAGALEKEFRYGLCVTPDTEALTETGWRRHDEILSGNRIATLHPSTGAFEWQEPIVREFRYSGDLVHFKSTVMDHLATPDHRMWSRLRRGAWRYREAGAAPWGNWVVGTAATAWDGQWKMSGPLADANAMDAAALVGWYLSEGCVTTGRGSRLEIAQSRSANPKKYAEIVALVDRLGLRPSLDPGKIRVCATDLAEWFKATFGTGCDDKKVPAWVRGWPTAQLTAMLDAMVTGDGHVVSKTCRRYTTTSPDIADAVQEISLKLGWGVQQVWRQRARRKPCCDLTMVLRSERSMPNRATRVAYDGPVWCPTVPNGLWFARRNGKVIVTGNCGHWHAMWSIPVMQNHAGQARVLWVNGSTESNNEWLREELKAQSPPGQWLLFAHDRRGVTSEHRVWLT